MSRGVPEKAIADCVVAGIEAAQAQHADWTNDRRAWLDEAPECLLTVEIARALGRQLKSRWINLEYGVKQAVEDAKSTKRGRKPKALRANGRFDILLSRKGGDPWCAIEVKTRVWSTGTIKSDIHRVVRILDHRAHGGTVSAGVVAFYSSAAPTSRASAREHLKNRGENALSAATKVAKAHDDRIGVTLASGQFHRVGDEGWQAFCLFFHVVKQRKR